MFRKKKEVRASKKHLLKFYHLLKYSFVGCSKRKFRKGFTQPFLMYNRIIVQISTLALFDHQEKIEAILVFDRDAYLDSLTNKICLWTFSLSLIRHHRAHSQYLFLTFDNLMQKGSCIKFEMQRLSYVFSKKVCFECIDDPFLGI